jgi:hypothetical protein
MRLRLLVSASVVALLLAQTSPARADGVLPAAATPVQREQAQGRFLRGKDLMAKKKYDEALVELRASHDIVTSPNTRLQIARCLLVMGRMIDAYAELGRTAVEAKELTGEDNRYQRAYDAATAERAEIEPKLGFVSLTIDNPSDGTQVTVGGEEIRRAAWSEPAPVQAGATELVVVTPGHDPIKRTVTVAAGERTSLTIDARSGAAEAVAPTPAPLPLAQPAPSPTHGGSWMRTGAYVAGGVGVVGLATFAIFGVMARSTYDDLNGACGGGPCSADKADEISSGRTKQTVANIGLAFGIVGAAAGATLFVVSMPRGTQASSAALVVSPGWIGVRGNL